MSRKRLSLELTDKTTEFIKLRLSQTAKRSLNDFSLNPAAVMILVYPKDGLYHILLNKRSQKVVHHKGEISFPGGVKDPEDETLLDTALRETYEEIGVFPPDITVLGQLSDVATNTGYVVTPFVGTISYPYKFKLSEAEIDKVIEVPLSALLDPRNWREEIRVMGKELAKSYSYAYNGYLIYGATARILDQFVDLFQEESKRASKKAK